MASSIMHMCVGKEVAKQIEVKIDEFLYGNILPDFLAVKDYKKKGKLHFYKKMIIGNIVKDNVDLDIFLSQYAQYISDSVSLGVYSHLITDYLWIKNFTINHLINVDGNTYLKTKRGNIRNNRITVYNDYAKMTEWLVNKYSLSNDFIINVNYNGFFKQIYNLPQEKIYEKITDNMLNIRKDQLDIFSQKEIEDFIQNASKEVINCLSKINGGLYVR